MRVSSQRGAFDLHKNPARAGDISATEEASGLATEGVEHRQRLQGGLLGDGALILISPPATGLVLALCLIVVHVHQSLSFD